MEKYDIYFDKAKGHSILGYDGLEETEGIVFLCSASHEEIDDEIHKRDRVNREYRFAFEHLGTDRLDEISNMFRRSTALLDAVASCNEILVADLLQSGADPNYQAPNGKTALMIAAQYGYESHYEIVQLLVLAGASLKIKDEHGFTALHYANEVSSDETWKPYIADFLQKRLFFENAADNVPITITNHSPFRIAITETYVKEVEIYAPDEITAHQMAEDLCRNGDIALDYENFVERSTECRGIARPIDLELHDVYGKEETSHTSLERKIQTASTRASGVESSAKTPKKDLSVEH